MVNLLREINHSTYILERHIPIPVETILVAKQTPLCKVTSDPWRCRKEGWRLGAVDPMHFISTSHRHHYTLPAHFLLFKPFKVNGGLGDLSLVTVCWLP
jgi:hypothetical protein